MENNVRINRRQILQTSIGAIAAAAAPAFLHLAKAADGFFEITAGKSKKKLYIDDAPDSELWTYNESSPGPEIRVKRGERIRVRLINNLEEPTSIHWHGIRIANNMDGVSGLTQEAVKPGDVFEYDFVVPDAGTYWYHAHNRSWNQVARGLYGTLIVEDDGPTFDRDHDLTLVVDDWRLNREGVLDVDSIGSMMDWSHGGRLGNWLTVNSQSLPNFKLNSGEPYRLRFINVSNARVFEIDPARFDAKILAYDGQPLATPIKLEYSPLLIGPAQRVDFLVIPEANKNFSIEEISRKTPFSFVNFKIQDNVSQVLKTPALLLNNLPEPDIDNAKTFNLHMSGGAMGGGGDIIYKGKKLEGGEFRTTGQVWAFNGVANLAEKPFFQVKRGETVSIEVFNDTVFIHAMHIHGHHFRIINREGSTIDEGSPWRDTFVVGPRQTTSISFLADNPGKWLLHCHMLEHAAAGMNTWFEVT
jgi:FtsP/CotA-like multicopper oxidase with cupredoxin domain